MTDAFSVVARSTSTVLGSAWVFTVPLLIIVVWAVTGPTFHFSDTWQVIINTGTTIVTFLMVFLIQNTQNRDAKSAHLKLDEIIRGLGRARKHLANMEMPDENLEELQNEFSRVREKATRVLKKGRRE